MTFGTLREATSRFLSYEALKSDIAQSQGQRREEVVDHGAVADGECTSISSIFFVIQVD